MPADEALNGKAPEPGLSDLLKEADRELREIEDELSRLAARKRLFLALRRGLAVAEGERRDGGR